MVFKFCNFLWQKNNINIWLPNCGTLKRIGGGPVSNKILDLSDFT